VVRPYSTCESAGSLVVQVMAAPDRVTDETMTEEMSGGIVSAVPMPVTERDAAPALELKLTVPAELPAAAGLKRATTVWLAPAAGLNEPPEATLNGAELEAASVWVQPSVVV